MSEQMPRRRLLFFDISFYGEETLCGKAKDFDCSTDPSGHR